MKNEISAVSITINHTPPFPSNNTNQTVKLNPKLRQHPCYGIICQVAAILSGGAPGKVRLSPISLNVFSPPVA